MKLAIRLFAMSVVLGGFAAAFSSSSAPITTSHQAVATRLPGPYCGPGVPTCPK